MKSRVLIDSGKSDPKFKGKKKCELSVHNFVIFTGIGC